MLSLFKVPQLRMFGLITLISPVTKITERYTGLRTFSLHDCSHSIFAKDFYDGLLDITHGVKYVTVSYSWLHDHYKGSLVGHSDSNVSVSYW